MHSLLHSDTNKQIKTTAFLLWLYMAFTGLSCHSYQFDNSYLTVLLCSRKFDEPFKVIHIDKPTVDYYAKLTSFYAQFRAIGVNYNQVVKAINTHLTPKKALAFLYKLEKATLELVAVTRNVIALTKEFEEKYIKTNQNNTNK